MKQYIILQKCWLRARAENPQLTEADAALYKSVIYRFNVMVNGRKKRKAKLCASSQAAIAAKPAPISRYN